MGVEPFLVAEATRGALAQRLVRTLCSSCAQPHVDTLERPIPLKDHDASSWKQAGDGPECREGYSGRTGVYEWLTVDATVRESIRTRAPIETVRKQALALGFVDLWGAAAELLDQGVTSLAEVRAVLGKGE